MSDKVFLDTNVLVHAFGSKLRTGPDRRMEIARRILADGASISVQVLNEFVQVCRRKAKLDWEPIAESLEVIKDLCLPAVPLTMEMHDAAVALSKRHQFDLYDSLILAAALEAKCMVLYTEDLQHGQVIEGLRIENPFVETTAP